MAMLPVQAPSERGPIAEIRPRLGGTARRGLGPSVGRVARRRRQGGRRARVRDPLRAAFARDPAVLPLAPALDAGGRGRQAGGLRPRDLRAAPRRGARRVPPLAVPGGPQRVHVPPAHPASGARGGQRRPRRPGRGGRAGGRPPRGRSASCSTTSAICPTSSAARCSCARWTASPTSRSARSSASPSRPSAHRSSARAAPSWGWPRRATPTARRSSRSSAVWPTGAAGAAGASPPICTSARPAATSGTACAGARRSSAVCSPPRPSGPAACCSRSRASCSAGPPRGAPARRSPPAVAAPAWRSSPRSPRRASRCSPARVSRPTA